MFAVFKNARKMACGAVLAISALALAACEPVALNSGPTINPSKPVKVALLVPLGSSQSGDAVIAQSLENAARMAIADLDGVKVDLRIYDTAGSPEVAANVAGEAIKDGAGIILGPLYAEAANAVGLVAAKKGVNVLAFSNNTAIAGGNVFILGSTFENTARRLTRYAVQHGKPDILVVAGDNPAGSAGREAINRAAAGTSARVAGAVTYELSQQGVINSIPNIRDAANRGGVDAIFMTATTAGALPLLTQLLPEAGVSPERFQYIGLTRWDIPAQTLELTGVQDAWFALPDPTQSGRFNSRYTATYGTAAHPIGGLAYDGIAAIGALAKQGRSNALTAEALTQGAGFQGTGGIFRLRPDGTNERGLAVATVQDKKVVIIDPAPKSFAGAGL